MKTKLIVIGLVLLVGTFLFPVFHVVESHQPVFEDDEVISWKERTWEEFLKEENMSEEAISEGYRHFFILTPPKFVSLSEKQIKGVKRVSTSSSQLEYKLGEADVEDDFYSDEILHIYNFLKI